MNIQHLTSNYPQCAFKSCSRSYTNTNIDTPTDRLFCTTTWIFRDDIDWRCLTQFMNNNFSNKPKVNIYSLACSDGSEPYTLAISMMEHLSKDKQNKFFPIHASDIDPEVIKAAKTGRLNLTPGDMMMMDKQIASKKTYFIDRQGKIEIDCDLYDKMKSFSFKPVDELASKIEFKHADMIEQIDKIEDEGNTVILCRNVTPYFDEDYREKLARKLQEKLKPGSLVVIGQFDLVSDFTELLSSKDGVPMFRQINRNIYQRMDGYKDYLAPRVYY